MEDWRQKSPSFITHWTATQLRQQRVGLQKRKKETPGDPQTAFLTLSPPDVSHSPPTDKHPHLLTLYSHSLTSRIPPTHQLPDGLQEPRSLTSRPPRHFFLLQIPKTHARAHPDPHETHAFPIPTSSHARPLSSGPPRTTTTIPREQFSSSFNFT